MVLLTKGCKIRVFNSEKVELGDGTFKRKVVEPGLNLTVYECEEHTLLAKGSHFIEVDGVMHQVHGLPVEPASGI